MKDAASMGIYGGKWTKEFYNWLALPTSVSKF